jgi:hypothetical protein
MKKQFLFKIFFVSVLALTMALAPIQTRPVEAAWGEFPAQFLGNALAMMRAQILGMIMGSLKQAAIKTITSKISSIVGGSSSQDSKIISNYTDFLHTDPLKKSKLYLNDYLSQMTQGRGSISSYISVSEGFGSNAGNYIAQLKQSALAITTEIKQTIPSYHGNPSQNMFVDGNLNNFNLYLSGVNNPWAFNLTVQQKYQEIITIQQDAARTEALANRGFMSTKQGDTIISPGSLTGDIMARVQTMGLDVLANAQSVPEIITSAVQGIITSAIQKGIGKAQNIAQKEVDKVTGSATQQIDKLTQKLGPAAAYVNTASNVYNSATNTYNNAATIYNNLNRPSGTAIGSNYGSTYVNPDTGTASTSTR